MEHGSAKLRIYCKLSINQQIGFKYINTNIIRFFQLHGIQFKRRAPRAVKEIKKFATLHMGTEDVRLDPKLNVALWKRGIQGVPTRLRLRISRKKNEEESAKSKMFSYVEYVNVPSIKGLQTTVVEDEA
ncbi:60S ribosomal protein L31B [Brettanomyces bruxellensis]|nr:60S ribosomal protein L31B [Brettanomyces bruxellensis]